MSDEREDALLLGGIADGEHITVNAGVAAVRVPVMKRQGEFKARMDEDHWRWVEEWDGPRDYMGLPVPPIGYVEYKRTEERSQDGAAIFRWQDRKRETTGL